jgi:hypothetical protein
MTVESDSESNPAPTYDIRLYNSYGTLLRQGKIENGSLQLNVSDLSNGTYYLLNYDGISDTPEKYQIIVKH